MFPILTSMMMHSMTMARLVVKDDVATCHPNSQPHSVTPCFLCSSRMRSTSVLLPRNLRSSADTCSYKPLLPPTYVDRATAENEVWLARSLTRR